MSRGLDNLKHIVVLMMEHRSFDHMLGGLKAQDRRINGLTGNETNPDTTGEPVKVRPLAEFQGFLVNPDNRYSAVNKQLFLGTEGPPTEPSMQGFVQSYFDACGSVSQARKIMYYFSPDKLPVLTTLARDFAVFNGWFSSVPGPTLCNHAFAHFGSSFGRVDLRLFEGTAPYLSIYERLLQAGHSAKIYYYDEQSSTMAPAILLKSQPQLFATYDQFLSDCRAAALPDYSFIEPNYTDHDVDDGEALASDQHPDHDVQTGELFIASVYNAIRGNQALWESTALLIVYDEHGGIYDHVPPPSCTPDAPFVASAQDTETGAPFAFDRLGVRVPAILISPWISKATVVPGTEDPVKGRVFEHASIPNTVTQFFIGNYDNRSPREKTAQTFVDLLSDEMRTDAPFFNIGGVSGHEAEGERIPVDAPDLGRAWLQELAGYQSDQPEGQDLLDIANEVEALASVLAAKEVFPPLSLGLFGDWGTGKSFFMRQLENRIRVLQEDAQAAKGDSAFCEDIVQITFNAWNYIDTDLWASLTSEIFEGLAAALARRRGIDSQDERARVLAAASSSRAVLVEAEKKKAEADEALSQNQQRLTALQNSRDVIEASLDPLDLFSSAYRFAIGQPEVQEYIKCAGKELHIDQVETAAGEVRSEILELHGIWSTILFTMRHTEKLWIWIVAFAVAVVFGWISTLLLRHSSLAGLMAQITSLLVAVSGFLGCFLPGARRALSFIQKARDAKAQLIAGKEEKDARRLTSQRAELIAEVENARREVEAAAKRASALNEQLEQLRADRRLSDYIRQRNESTDYTKHLGLIARVRMDFKQLSTLLRDVKEEADSEMKRRQEDKDNAQILFPRIDRIVLYIDDLDRCPEKNVVEVLQAVNLLLAFPLFVVVVGVDPRWLLHSLEQHSVALLARRDEGRDTELEFLWQSTPLNYLEKIFQIPYTLRPMDSRGFAKLVDALSGAPDSVISSSDASKAAALSPMTKASAPAAASTPSESTEVPGSKEATVEETRPIDRRPQHLRIEQREQSFMKLLSGLIPSPRAGKRFINIYRLLRASVKQDERAAFIGEGNAGEHQCALLLLGILTGYPAEATEILRDLIQNSHDETWWVFIENLEARKLSNSPKKDRRRKRDVSGVPDPARSSEDGDKTFQGQRWGELFNRLRRLRPSVYDHPCAAFARWAPRIARYSFQSGRVLLNAR